MALLSDLTRPYWLSGIHQVSGQVLRGLGSWFVDEEYQVYAPLTLDSAVLHYGSSSDLVRAFAADASRMAAAAFETLEDIRPSAALPKSLGWLLVRAYYSAFYAAHSCLRMFGRSCTQFDGEQLASVHAIADLYGQRNAVTLTRGLYGLRADPTNGTLRIRKRSGADGGSHGAMWTMFLELLNDLSSDVLSSGAAPVPTQQVSGKLIELREALVGGGFAGGNWLSNVRNRVNYQLAFGAWFPYKERQKYYESLFEACALWREDPMRIQIWPQRGRDLQRFIESSALIVAICRDISEDMARRCTSGKSFQYFGSLALLHRMAS